MKIKYNKDIQNYTESNLIAYIGNKRRLINLIIKSLETLDLDKKKEPITFFDPFAGTGVISRLAKAQGFRVISNDWEPYTYYINKTYIELNPSDYNKMFVTERGIDKTIEHYNQLSDLPYKNTYIAQYYCPKDSQNPAKSERLFYTRETGDKIDAIRSEIVSNYENKRVKSNNLKVKSKEKNLLLSTLLYEAATRANTSGVFKAFHNGFGGLGKDALTRILKPLKLHVPKLWESKQRNKVFCTCANKLAKKLKNKVYFDIVYLDPPYNQHQYGSNYHLLNTIALNDKPQVNKSIFVNGKRVDKSAIRKDWIKTKSPYCYASTATTAFEDIINNLNCRYILTSYSIDGIIPFHKMLEILSKRGKLSIISSEYVKYRGGRQSTTMKTNNIEFVLIVDTTKPSSKQDTIKIHEQLLNQKLDNQLKLSINESIFPSVNFNVFKSNELTKVYSKKYKDYKIFLETEDGYKIINYYFKNGKISNNKSEFYALPFDVKDSFYKDLSVITNIDKEQEIKILINLLLTLINLYKSNPDNMIIEKLNEYLPRIPFLVNKFNSPKTYPKYLEIKNTLDMLIEKIKKEIISFHPLQRFNTAMKQLNRIFEIKNKKILAAKMANKI